MKLQITYFTEILGLLMEKFTIKLKEYDSLCGCMYVWYLFDGASTHQW